MGTTCRQLPVDDYCRHSLYAIFLRLRCHSARVHIMNFDVARVASETLDKLDRLFASRTTSTKNFDLTFPFLCHNYFSFLSRLKLSSIGQSLAGPLPQQESVSRTSAFFIALMFWIFPSMSSIYVLPSLRTPY